MLGTRFHQAALVTLVAHSGRQRCSVGEPAPMHIRNYRIGGLSVRAGHTEAIAGLYRRTRLLGRQLSKKIAHRADIDPVRHEGF
jgi:hypothetical protein